MAGNTSRRPSKAKTPSPPLTAYNLYFRYERARLLFDGHFSKDCSHVKVTSSDLRDFMAKNPYQPPASRKKRTHTKTHGAISFSDLSRAVSRKWKDLDAESKQPFKEVAYELKVDYYRKLEDERRRAKQNKVFETEGEKSGEATKVLSEQGDKLIFAPSTAPRSITKEQQQLSSHDLFAEGKGVATVKEENHCINTQGLQLSLIAATEPPMAKKPRVEKELLFAPSPESPIVSLPEWPDTFPVDFKGGTNSDKKLLTDNTFEPIDLRHNAHEVSPVLDKDFAEIWLTNTFHGGLSKPTHDKEHKTGKGSLGIQELLDMPFPSLPDLFSSTEVPFSMGELDMEWTA